jgi:hypothetical protein
LDYHALVAPFYGIAVGRSKRFPLDPAAGSGVRQSPPGRRIDDAERSIFNEGENVMSKSQDSKKNVKKAPTKTPKEKKEAKRLKKAEKKY